MRAKSVFLALLACGLCSCGDDEESQSVAEEPKSERPARKSSGVARSSQPDPAKPSKSAGARQEQSPKVEITSSKPPLVDPSILPKGTNEERAKLRAERAAKEREERMARMTEQIGEAVRQADANGDGLISESEVPQILARRFSDHDSNGDGSLDAAEQKVMLESFAERMSSFGRGGGGERDGRGGRRGGN